MNAARAKVFVADVTGSRTVTGSHDGFFLLPVPLLRMRSRVFRCVAGDGVLLLRCRMAGSVVGGYRHDAAVALRAIADGGPQVRLAL